MPNYVDNILTVNGPNVADIVAFVRTEKREFDFNNVIPMPQELKHSRADSDADFGLIMVGIPNPNDQSRMTAEAILSYPWITDAGVTTVAELREYLSRDPRAPEFEKAARIAERCISATGYANWFDWCTRQWGTKWNAMEAGGHLINETEVVFGFRTAWYPPLPIVAKLSDLYPECTFVLESIDEYDEWRRGLKFKSGQIIERFLYDEDGEPALPLWDHIRAEIERDKSNTD